MFTSDHSLCLFMNIWQGSTLTGKINKVNKNLIKEVNKQTEEINADRQTERQLSKRETNKSVRQRHGQTDRQRYRKRQINLSDRHGQTDRQRNRKRQINLSDRHRQTDRQRNRKRQINLLDRYILHIDRQRDGYTSQKANLLDRLTDRQIHG